MKEKSRCCPLYLQVQPKEDKFRKVKLSNKKINAAIVGTEGGLDAMMKLGWVQSTTEEDGDVLVLPEGKYLNMETVRKVEEAKERLEKANKDAARLGKKPSVTDMDKVRPNPLDQSLDHECLDQSFPRHRPSIEKARCQISQRWMSSNA